MTDTRKPKSRARKSAPATTRQATAKPKSGSTGKGTRARATPSRPEKAESLEASLKTEEGSLISRLINLPGDMVGGAYRLAVKKTEGPLRVGKALLLRPEQAKMLEEAGKSIHDLREVVGLTRDELSDILDVKDQSLLEAVENGTAILSFELILKLAAVLARNDPLPFIMRYTRTYKPELWQILEDWGIGGLYLNFERERQFINIYRRHDAARNLSDASFERILDFTREAFDTAIHFAAEYEQVEDIIVDEEDETAPPTDD